MLAKDCAVLPVGLCGPQGALHRSRPGQIIEVIETLTATIPQLSNDSIKNAKWSSVEIKRQRLKEAELDDLTRALSSRPP